ncbi:hypothetical protein [Siccirubricoccus phaeus]|uniref:hypothetical protein n=1 Tax=Siccirubricoccus phaeus TaxID=2595053 RepID=UPI0011F285B2|nr:hypothetical protein [Siccirubricoccus phaeus]
MAPPLSRLRLLLLLPLLGCAAGTQGEALQQALESGQASLAAIGAGAGPGVVRPSAGLADAPAPVAVAAAAGPPAEPAAPLLQPVLTGPSRTGPTRSGQAGPPASAAELLGLNPAELRLRLGEPALRRPEGPGEIWLYTAAACALDLVLYREGRAGLRVAHAAARANGPAPRTEAACLSEIASPPGGGLPGGTGA